MGMGIGLGGGGGDGTADVAAKREDIVMGDREEEEGGGDGGGGGRVAGGEAGMMEIDSRGNARGQSEEQIRVQERRVMETSRGLWGGVVGGVGTGR